MKTRGFNFGAGPATLPEALLQQAKAELLNWQGQGMSVMEISHRSEAFMSLLADAEKDLRDLLVIPDNYSVLFLTQPARMQFAMLPMNFLQSNADYLVTGTWSKLAATEAAKLGQVTVVADGKEDNYLSLPNRWSCSENADYFYYTPNETLTGLAVHEIPDVGDTALVADMTSCILSKPIDISRYALIFAGSQKNIGPAGLTIVIANNDFLARKKASLPLMLDYQVHQSFQSNYATPATFLCYMASLMFKWLKQQGGLSAMAVRNEEKAQALYQYIDNSSGYTAPVNGSQRSAMNVAFRLNNASLEPLFLAEAKKAGLLALKGHRSVGGCRASIYNAMPMEGITHLISFMDEFKRTHL